MMNLKSNNVCERAVEFQKVYEEIYRKKKKKKPPKNRTTDY